MNKLFTKIGTAMVGIAMAIGVGVAVGRDDAKEVRAAAAIPVEATPLNFTGSDFTAVESSDYSKTKNGITIFVEASTVTSEQIRIFKNKTITISIDSGRIKEVEFTCTASGTTKYGPGCFAELSGYSYDGAKGTWSGTAESIELTASSNQVRATNIKVTYIPYYATNFADDFLSETDDVCTNYDGSSNNKAALQSVWTKLNHASFFGLLSTEQKNILKNATYTVDGNDETVPGAGVAQNIAEAVRRYDYLCKKYELANVSFLNRNIPGYAGAVNPFMASSNNNYTPIIVVSAVVLTALVGTLILLSRKRKED